MPDPNYRRIADDLQRRIESAEWLAGTRLPPECKLEEEYEASRNTVRDAVKWLTTRGLVSPQPGRGTFVNEPMKPLGITLSGNPQTGFGRGEGESYEDEVRAQRRVPETSPPKVEIQEADKRIASALRIGVGDAIISRHQERSIDSNQDALEVRPPKREEVSFFNIPDDGSVAVYVHYRIAYDRLDQPFRLTVSIFPTDRHQFAMFFGDHY